MYLATPLNTTFTLGKINITNALQCRTFFPNTVTYSSMTMASLEEVEKRPDTPTMLLCRIRASRSYSCRVWSRLRLRLQHKSRKRLYKARFIEVYKT